MYKGKILVVDDSFNNLKLVSNFLSERGFQILVGTTGAQAMKLIEAKSPDLVLLDVKLPDIDGFSICNSLRQQKQTVSLPIIFLTASNDPVSINQGFEVGGTDYVTKPINLNELNDRIETHIALTHLKKSFA